jgi:eukaryotic-like serine/threonine-protein kinase
VAVFAPTLTLIAVKEIDETDEALLIANYDIQARAGALQVSPSVACCPYLVGVYGIYKDMENNILNQVQEYMNAGSIQTKIKEKTIFSADDAVVLAYSILRALKAIHESGVVHHDVSPTNMLANSDGHIKLAPFGAVAGLVVTSFDT